MTPSQGLASLEVCLAYVAGLPESFPRDALLSLLSHLKDLESDAFELMQSLDAKLAKMSHGEEAGRDALRAMVKRYPFFSPKDQFTLLREVRAATLGKPSNVAAPTSGQQIKAPDGRVFVEPAAPGA